MRLTPPVDANGGRWPGLCALAGMGRWAGLGALGSRRKELSCLDWRSCARFMRLNETPGLA
jgi:hypothetical protein